MKETVSKEQRLAVEAFKKRRDENEPKMIDSSSLPAGTAMCYYCKHCYALTTKISESDFTTEIKDCCGECKAMKEKGWLK
ncbi:MAG: hypothetical protein G01um101413_515 [Parcubacteria group bacterium Gr01-1014_13]|nr:MAG: hypothetical protein G01um101413_515 [Parcubacteria group bacterium Gr01-1014_13]